MRRVELTLPDKVYYEYQAQAGKKRRETEEWMEEVLVRESGVDADKMSNSSDGEQTFRQFVLDWDWPNDTLKEGTKQAENVVGVIRRMKDGFDFADAARRQAEEVRRNSEKNLADNYHTTVRAQCAKEDMGVVHGANQFSSEVDKLLREYEN